MVYFELESWKIRFLIEILTPCMVIFCQFLDKKVVFPIFLKEILELLRKCLSIVFGL